MGLFKRLRRRFSGASIESAASTPTVPIAVIQQQRAIRGYAASIPAAEWTYDITRANKEIADAHNAEVERRRALLERGEYVSRFGSIETDMLFEMRTQDVTGLQPSYPLLSTKEDKDARTVSRLTSEIQMIERQQMDPTITIPARPSKREVLEAAGGDGVRAALVEKKLDELYGVEMEAEA